MKTIKLKTPTLNEPEHEKRFWQQIWKVERRPEYAKPAINCWQVRGAPNGKA